MRLDLDADVLSVPGNRWEIMYVVYNNKTCVSQL